MRARLLRCLLALLVLVPVVSVLGAPAASAYTPPVPMECNLGMEGPGEHENGPPDAWEFWASCWFHPDYVPYYSAFDPAEYNIDYLVANLVVFDDAGQATAISYTYGGSSSRPRPPGELIDHRFYRMGRGSFEIRNYLPGPYLPEGWEAPTTETCYTPDVCGDPFYIAYTNLGLHGVYMQNPNGDLVHMRDEDPESSWGEDPSFPPIPTDPGGDEWPVEPPEGPSQPPSQINPYANFGQSFDGSVSGGDPVDVTTGNFHDFRADLAFPGTVMGLDWSRTYNSLDERSGVLGRGWSTSYGQNVVDNGDGSVTLTDADGRTIEFEPDGGAGFAEPMDFPGNLVDDGDGTYSVVFPDSTTWNFDANGRIETIRDWTGQVVAIGRDGSGLPTTVASSTGYSLTFGYGANGLLDRVDSSDGRFVTYGYHPDDTLASATFADGGTETYQTSGGVISEIRDQEGRLVIANTYDPDSGRVLSQQTPHGGTVSFSYDEENQTTTIADQARGETTSYSWSGPGGAVTAITDSTGSSVARGYTDEVRLDSFTDRENGAYSNVLDADTGLPTSIVEPLSDPTSIEYDDENRVWRVTNAEDGVTTFEYEGVERIPSKVTDPETGETFIESEDGLVTSVTDPDGVTTSFGWDSRRNLVSVSDELSNTWSFTHHAAGWRETTTSPLGHTGQVSYDPVGRVDWAKDANEATTDYTWDASGRLRLVTDPLSYATEYQYNAAGDLSAVIDANSNTTSYLYNTGGQLTSITEPDDNDPTGAVTTFTYGPLSRLETVTDPTGVTTTYGYNDNGLRETVTDEGGNAWTTHHDAKGRVDWTEDPEGNRVTLTYDDLDQVTQSTTADGSTVFEYDGNGNLVYSRDPRGVEATSTYTPGGRLEAISNAYDETVTYVYDDAGRLERVVDAESGETVNVYDDDSRLVQVTSPEGRSSGFGYDPAGRQTSLTDGSGQTWTTVFNDRGEVTATVDPLDATVEFAYDGVGNPISVTDANDNAVTMGYDARNNRTSRTSVASGAVETWAYNKADQITSYTDQLGVATTLHSYNGLGQLETVVDTTGLTQTMGYDTAGRVASVTYGDGTSASFGYDPMGRRDTMVDGRGTTTYVYDTSGNLTSVAEADGDTVSYGWDLANRRTSITNPDGTTVSYSYTLNGWLESVDHPGLGVTAYSYDDDGLLTGEDLPGDDSRTLAHDAAGHLDAFTQSLAGVTSSYDLGYDAAGHLTSMTTGGPATWDDWTYTYDPAGQLTAANRGAPGGIDDFAFTYDEHGNRLTKAKGGFVWTQGFNDANQMSSSQVNTTTPWSYAYDDAGRRTEARQGTTRYEYDYDGAGRLEERRYVTQWWIFTSTWAENYTYTGDGQLAELTVTEPNRTVHEYDLTWDNTTGVPQVVSIDDGGGDDTFIYGTNRIGVDAADGTTAPFSYDPFGSALATSATEDWARSATYSPYGQQQNSAWSDPLAHVPAFGYRGELTLDNTVHLRARTYEPGEGVFTTRDPLDGVAGTTTVTSPYSYADNDPNGHVDPLGLSATDADFENCLVEGTFGEGESLAEWTEDAWRDIERIDLANRQRLGLRCLSQTATAVSDFFSDLAVPCKDLFTDPSLASGAWCVVDVAGGKLAGGIVTAAPKVLRYGDELVQAVSTRIDNALARYGDEAGAINPATRAGGGATGDARFVVDSGGVATDLGPRVAPGRPVVIGEGMPGRVRPAAAEMGADVYSPPPLSGAQSLAHNRAWINEQMNQGRGIIDIGPAPGRSGFPEPSSLWYAMEREQIRVRGYQFYCLIQRC